MVKLKRFKHILLISSDRPQFRSLGNYKSPPEALSPFANRTDSPHAYSIFPSLSNLSCSCLSCLLCKCLCLHHWYVFLRISDLWLRGTELRYYSALGRFRFWFSCLPDLPSWTKKHSSLWWTVRSDSTWPCKNRQICCHWEILRLWACWVYYCIFRGMLSLKTRAHLPDIIVSSLNWMEIRTNPADRFFGQGPKFLSQFFKRIRFNDKNVFFSSMKKIRIELYKTFLGDKNYSQNHKTASTLKNCVYLCLFLNMPRNTDNSY